MLSYAAMRADIGKFHGRLVIASKLAEQRVSAAWVIEMRRCNAS